MSAGDDYDLVVIGGGIHGAGIARDAALRGLRTALFERDDLASGTSSASSKLVHGGLRYLEQFRFGLVRESLRERTTLRRIAPHLVRPLPFLAPLYDEAPRGRWTMEAGLWLYDLLASRGGLDRHRWLSAEQARALEPNLREQGLRGAFLFWDAQMDDARLVIENALDAARHGAMVRNGARAVDLLVEEQRVAGVRLRDASDGREWTVRAGMVVNAAGPWYADLSGRQDLGRPLRPRLSRGTHVVLGPLTRGHALLLRARQDGRVMFVLPWKGRSLVGTTDVDHPGDADAARPTPAEIDYLLREVITHLDVPAPRREDVLFAFAGVRALRPEEVEDPGRVGRDALVHEDAPGMLGVLGGKYTTYRAVAERVVDAVERRLGRGVSACRTAERVLPGGDVPPMNDYFEVAEDLLTRKYDRLEIGVLRYLLGTYGARHLEILHLLDDDPEAAAPVETGLPFTLAEVEHCLRTEWARDVDDVVRRRCYRLMLGGFDDHARAAWQRAVDRALDKIGRGVRSGA